MVALGPNCHSSEMRVRDIKESDLKFFLMPRFVVLGETNDNL